jgi:hypothetical protein
MLPMATYFPWTTGHFERTPEPWSSPWLAQRPTTQTLRRGSARWAIARVSVCPKCAPTSPVNDDGLAVHRA